MTKKDLIHIVFKTLIVYYFIISLAQTIGFIASLYASGQSIPKENSIASGITIFLLILLIIFIDKIISWLKIDSSFDEEKFIIEKVDFGKLSQYIVIIIGGMLFIEHFPQFIVQTFNIVQQKMSGESLGEISNYVTSMLITNIIYLLIGYLVITNNKTIASFINNKAGRVKEL